MQKSHPLSQATRLLGLFWRTFRNILLGYSVVFTIVVTVVGLRIGLAVYHPFREVGRLREHNPPQSAFMSQYRTTLREAGKADTLQHEFIALDSISPHLVSAVIAAEDDGFYMHPGIDFAAILSAAAYNRSHNKVRHGGSTLTQQTAKNLFLSAERTYRRKIIELVYAVLLEQVLGKERILELYLNYAQWGPGLFGCEAAAQHYYHKSASRLSLNESMRLAATLAQPERLTPYHRRSGLMNKRLATIATNLHFKHLISDEAYGAYLGLPAPGQASAQDSAGTPSSPPADTLSE